MPHWALALLFVLGQFSQSSTGELRLTVADGAGLPLPGPVRIASESTDVHQSVDTDAAGRVTFRRLPLGRYRVEVVRTGFAPLARLVEVQSALPVTYLLQLSLAPLRDTVTVTAVDTLLDPRRTSASHGVGSERLDQRTSALPGRALPDLVNSQPGWLLEANGILHPRGSEYQTQYVVDGLPLTDNRSPAFAPELGAGEIERLNILTGGYPAEYGRQLGGVIEVTTVLDRRRGAGGTAAVSVGSFATTSAEVLVRSGYDRTSLALSASAAGTDRYLDPPVEENFTNRGATAGASLQIVGDVTAADRVGVIARRGQSHFLVPNERVQEAAGQRQDRRATETAAQVSYQRVFSARLVGDLRGMLREGTAGLWSNDAATPIVVSQDRGFRTGYVKGTVTASAGSHELKAGVDAVIGTLRERFGYEISDPAVFSPLTPATFQFAGTRPDREASLFAQDRVRTGPWTLHAGLRWDRYRLVVSDQAFSPRLAAAWSAPAAGLVIRASYDRAFQTPAAENLLLASSEAAGSLDAAALRLPVPASRGNFYEAGVSQVIARRARLDLTYYVRRMRDVADDNLLLDTGVSFPIAFARADIRGTEITLDVPPWRNVSGSLGYAWMRGVGELPVTGGLFLGDEGTALLASHERFALTQDQRHTLRGRVSRTWSGGGWLGAVWSYGSGLPFEEAGDDPEEAAAQFGQRVVDRVDFATGRLRPSAALSVSGGVVLAGGERRRIRLQAEVRNATNRLDVINFAGLFSGTAVAAPRSVAVRLRADF